MKNFREKEAWAYPGTAQFFWIPPIISGTGRATDFKFGQYTQRVHPNKIPLKILEKRERGRIQGLPIFGVPPIISGTAKAAMFKFCTHIYRLNRNKSPLKIMGKVAVSSGTPENFQDTHTYGASRGHLCDSSAFLYFIVL